MEEHESDGGQQQHPQQLVAVVRTEYRVGRDPGRVVVGQAGEQPRTDDRQQRAETETLAPEAFHGVAPSPASLRLIGL